MRTVETPVPRPMVVVRGTIADRPWGATLAAIGLSGRDGQLALRSEDGKLYRIAFANGVMVGASSPLAVDSIARIALASKLVSAAQARTLARVEDLDSFAERANLALPSRRQLERRLILQRAARTFAVDAGAYAVDDRITIPVVPGIQVDVRAAIYLGMRMNLSPQRLSGTLRRVGGSRFVLRPEVACALAPFEFGLEEAPVLEALRHGTSLPEIEATHREIDPRMVEAVLCTLAVCDAITELALTSRVPTPQEASLARSPTPREPTVTRVPTPRAPTMSCVPMLIRQDPTVTSAPPPRVPVRRAATVRTGRHRMATDPFLDASPTRARPPALTRAEVEELIAIGAQLLARGVDHFTFLGLPFGAPNEDVRAAFLEFARYLRPEKLAELGIGDDALDARRVFAQVVIAFTVLTDPARRAEYVVDLVGVGSRRER